MPVVRSISTRRSRRLSTQQVIEDVEDWESWPGELLYPDSDPETITPPASQSCSSSPVVLPSSKPVPHPSHARQRPEHHIPRPPNPFILFRSDYCVWNRQLNTGAVRDHRIVSRLAGQAWLSLDSASRKKYEDLAQKRKAEHAEKYPNYAYAPSSRSGRGKKRKADDDCDYEERMPQPKCRRSRAGARPLSVVAAARSNGPSPTDRADQTGPALTAALSPCERLQTPELSPNTLTESDPEPILRTPVATSPHLVCDDDDFVPTADIPPLDLYAGAPTMRSIDPTVYLPAFEFRPKYGFKTEIPQQTRNERMWYPYNADGTYESTATSPDALVCPINYAEVQFTNPFALEIDFGDWIHTDRLQ